MPPLFSCKTTSPELYAEEMKKLARAEQSRVNGAKSRGPTSVAGKLKCSRGALKHGLTAKKHTILDIEDPAEYEHVNNAALEEFRPATVYAVRVVEKLADLDWRIERVAMLETAYLNYKSTNPPDSKRPRRTQSQERPPAKTNSPRSSKAGWTPSTIRITPSIFCAATPVPWNPNTTER